jgi:hypothetical protein
MHDFNGAFRFGALLTITGQLLLSPAVAQPVPAPPMLQAGPEQPGIGDPPARVGRLAQLNGTVSFRTPDATQWIPASTNYPVTSGDALWTDANAQAEIEVSASHIALAPTTELDIATLNDTALQAVQPQGELYLHLMPGTPGETYAVQTPRGLVNFNVPGRYAVTAGDTQTPTTIIVVDGAAQVSGPQLSLQVGPGQMATLNGTDNFTGSVSPAQHDGFLDAMLARERPPQPPAAPPPAVVAYMPGGEDLSSYGSWDNSSEYGAVWYPQVAPNWVPYSDGSWNYVAPWGWTWVDAEPWGFAPFHYGRWSRFGDRWGWIPGDYERGHPVYAPALVAFFGAGAIAGAGHVGWLPLGPHEPYRPWYHTSASYLRNVNAGRTFNGRPMDPGASMSSFANRGAANAMPISAFSSHQAMSGVAQRVNPNALAAARPLLSQPPVRSAAAPAGFAHEQRIALAPTPLRAPQSRPAIQPTPMGVVGAAPSLAAPHSSPGGVRAFPAQPALVVPGNRPMQSTPGGIPASVHPAAPVGPSPQFHGAPLTTLNPSMPAAAAIRPAAPAIARPAQPAFVHPNAPPPVAAGQPAFVQHPAAPAPQPQAFHAAPPPQPQAFHAAPQPQPQAFHAAPQPQARAPQPQPQVHAAPPQAFHAPPPQPAAHAAPPHEGPKRPGQA